jgi:multiple sugar transport system ATP-binding protein
MTSIFVTHDQTEANALADRIAMMEGGVLQQFANPKELRERPVNLFVATFVGEPPMNVFEASVVNADTISFAVKDGPTLAYTNSEVPQNVRAAIGRRDKVIIGVRPHGVWLGSGANKARVVSNQWLGDQSHLATDVASRLMVAVTHSPIAVKAGDTVAYRVAAADLHVFDAASGAAISHGLACAQ